MDINLSSQVNAASDYLVNNLRATNIDIAKASPTTSCELEEVQQTIDAAYSLLEVVISELSGSTLRNAPNDVYLELLSALDELVNASIKIEI